MSFDFLQPVSAAFDKNLIAHRGEFKFGLEHTNGEQMACNVEAFVLKSSEHNNSPQPTFDSLVLCYIESSGRSLMFPPFRKGHLVVSDYNIEINNQTIRTMEELRNPSSFIKLEDFNGSAFTIRSSSVAQIRLWKTYIDELFSSANDPFVEPEEFLEADTHTENTSYHFGSLSEEILSTPQRGLNIISPKSTHSRLDSYAALASFEKNMEFMENSLIDNPELKQFLVASTSEKSLQNIASEFVGNSKTASYIDTDYDELSSDSHSEEESILSEPDYNFSGSHNDSTSTLSKFEGINYTYVSTSSPILARLPHAGSTQTLSEDESSISTPVLSEEKPQQVSNNFQASQDTLSLPSSHQPTLQNESQNTITTESVDIEPEAEDAVLQHRQSLETIKSLDRSTTPEETPAAETIASNPNTTPTLSETKVVEAKVKIVPAKPTLLSAAHANPAIVPVNKELPPLKKKRSTSKLFGAIKQFFKSKKDSTHEIPPNFSYKPSLKAHASLSSLNNKEGGSLAPEPIEFQDAEVTYGPRPGTSFSLAARNDRCLSKISEEDIVYYDEGKKPDDKHNSTPVIEEEPEEPHSKTMTVNRISSSGSVYTSPVEPRINSVADSRSSMESFGNKSSVSSFGDRFERTIYHSRSESSVRTAINVDVFQTEKQESRTPNAPFNSDCETHSGKHSANLSISSFYYGYNPGAVSQSSSISTLYDRTPVPGRATRSVSTSRKSKNEILTLLSSQAIVSKWNGRKWDKLDNGFVITNVSVYSAEQGGLVECKLITNENILTLKVLNKTSVRRATFQDIELQGVESVTSFGNNDVFLFRFMNISDADEFANSIEACKKEFTSQAMLESKPSLRKMKSADLLSSTSSVNSLARSDVSVGRNSLINRPQVLRSYSSAGSLKGHRSNSHKVNASLDSDHIYFTSTKAFTPTLLPPLLSNKNIRS